MFARLGGAMVVCFTDKREKTEREGLFCLEQHFEADGEWCARAIANHVALSHKKAPLHNIYGTKKTAEGGVLPLCFYAISTLFLLKCTLIYGYMHMRIL